MLWSVLCNNLLVCCLGNILYFTVLKWDDRIQISSLLIRCLMEDIRFLFNDHEKQSLFCLPRSVLSVLVISVGYEGGGGELISS